MADELNLNQLRQERLNLLIRMGEEAHKQVRDGELLNNEKISEVSKALQAVDIQIGKLTGMFEYKLDKCPNCGTTIEEGNAFCGSCGFSIRDFESQFTSKCDVCGARITENQEFCEICGTKLK